MFSQSASYSLVPFPSLLLCNKEVGFPLNCLAIPVDNEELSSLTNRLNHVEQEECGKKVCDRHKKEQQEKLKKCKENLHTTELTHYYYSVRDQLTGKAKAYRYSYDDGTSVSTIVSVPSILQKDHEHERSEKQSRFDQLYEHGKARKRSELKAFLQQKDAQNASILRKGTISKIRSTKSKLDEVLSAGVAPRHQFIHRAMIKDYSRPRKEKQKVSKTNTTKSTSYHHSIPDKYPRRPTNHDSVPKVVSLLNTFQEDSKKNKISKGQHRFDRLYEYGKEKKRSELKRFQKEKVARDASFLHRGGSSTSSSVLYL